MSANTQPISPVRSGESQASEIYGLTIVFAALACATVVLRLYTRQRILHTLGLDDVTITIALVLSFGVTITTIFQVAVGGLGRHSEFLSQDQFLAGIKGLYSNLIVYNAAQLMTKISLLLQYRRLFPDVVIQRLCTSALALLMVWGVIQQFITAFSCVPLAIMIPHWRGRCINTFAVFNTNSIMNMLTDFAILVIPITPVMRLQMPKRRKVHLLVVFCLGFLACAISIVRLHELYRTKDSQDQSWDSSATAYWSVIELNLGILCACLPTLRPLIKKYVPQLLGSTAPDRGGAYGSRHMLATIGTGKFRPGAQRAIYVQHEVEFQSTTELRDIVK